MTLPGRTLRRALNNLSVRVRLPLLLLLVCLLFVGLALVWGRETQHQLERLNAKERVTKKALVEQIIQLKSEQLSGLAYDYGAWDDLRDFLKTSDPSWARNNLLAVLKGQNTDGIWVYRRDGFPVLASFRDPEKALTLKPETYLSLFPARKAERWYERQGEQVWELYGTTIHNGEDAEHRGAFYGYVVIGRILSKEYLVSLRGLSQCQLALKPERHEHPQSEPSLFDTRLTNRRGESVAVIHARLPDTQAVVIQEAVLHASSYFVLIAVLAAVVVGYALLLWIGLPIEQLSGALRRKAPEVLEGLKDQKNEFGELAQLALNFFEQERTLVQLCDDLEGRVARRTEELTYQAYHDALTGLPNRRRFREALDAALQSGNREQGLAVVFMDLDNFKVINDSLGHEAGDRVLQIAAQRMQEAVRTHDLVARLSGDEFAILIPKLPEVALLPKIVGRIQEAFRVPVLLQEKSLVVTASIGAAFFTGEESAADLLRNADTAMYTAKTQDKGGIALFDSSMKQRADRRLELELGLREALQSHPEQLYVVYQPIVGLDDKQVRGVEALVRWNHPTLGTISPGTFIPIAEEAGLIREVGSLVLEQAAHQVVAWSASLDQPLRLSVNLSVQELQEPDIVKRVRETTERLGLTPQQLELEITESVMMTHPELVADRLAHLRSEGIRVAVDDFGTGYSSMAVLAQLPLDVIKIDRSFVAQLGTHPPTRAIVQAILELAGALGLSTTAEGIETTEQWELLAELGCAKGQGFHFCQPLTASELQEFLYRHRTPALSRQAA